MSAAPAVAQPADPIQQFQVRIVDVPRAEALKALPTEAFDGKAHALGGDIVSRLLDSSGAVPVNSFGSSTRRELLIAEDETTIDFKLTEGERTAQGLRVGYLAEFTEGQVSKVIEGSGVIAPGGVLVSVEDGDGPDVSRLTVLSVD
jgi:hypothetical protein